MLLKFSLSIVVMLFFNNALVAQNYQLQLNDTSINITVGRVYDMYINGKATRIALTEKDTLEFSNSNFSFLYPKGYSPSKHLIDSTAEQFTILTAEGSGILVQHYFTMNPILLEELMLREITKESIDYGYKLKRDEYELTLKSGQTIRVIKATLTYKEDTSVYEIAAVGKKDEGLMIITINMSPIAADGSKIINLLWNSLKYF